MSTVKISFVLTVSGSNVSVNVFIGTINIFFQSY